jgi:hypothetical protein
MHSQVTVGDIVGDSVGVGVGDWVGDSVGDTEGDLVGLRVGFSVGEGVGDRVGESVGLRVGDGVGGSVGAAVSEHSARQTIDSWRLSALGRTHDPCKYSFHECSSGGKYLYLPSLIVMSSSVVKYAVSESDLMVHIGSKMPSSTYMILKPVLPSMNVARKLVVPVRRYSPS